MKICKCSKCDKEVKRIQKKRYNICDECRRIKDRATRRQYRKRIRNADAHKYEKTINGFLVRKYRNMQSRIQGIQKLKSHLYFGKSLLDRIDFYQWAYAQPKFWKLFKEWENSNYERKLCPTVNRIDPLKGYEESNMEWLTHSENSRYTSRNKKI